jgi:hypothetical protein
MNPADILGFCPELINLLNAREIAGKTGKRFQALGSISTFNNLVCLRKLFLQSKPKRTLEIGMAFGGSALLFTGSHRDSGAAPSCQHTAVDPFQTTYWDDAGLSAIERVGLAGYLDLREQLSSLELPIMLQQGALFDMAYVDGSHMFEDVFVDFYFVRQMMFRGNRPFPFPRGRTKIA